MKGEGQNRRLGTGMGGGGWQVSCPVYVRIWMSREELRLSLVHKGEPWKIFIHEDAMTGSAR